MIHLVSAFEIHMWVTKYIWKFVSEAQGESCGWEIKLRFNWYMDYN